MSRGLETPSLAWEAITLRSLLRSRLYRLSGDSWRLLYRLFRQLSLSLRIMWLYTSLAAWMRSRTSFCGSSTVWTLDLGGVGFGISSIWKFEDMEAWWCGNLRLLGTRVIVYWCRETETEALPLVGLRQTLSWHHESLEWIWNRVEN